MKKKKYIMTIMVIIIFLSWSQTINASIINDLGTVSYTKYLQLDIFAPNELELVYVHSTIDEDALEISKLSYIPSTNITRYLFTSNIYDPEYWEHLDQEIFIYQDINSKNLYMVKIDMSNISIPSDPWMIDFYNMSNEYNFTYALLQENINNLTETRDELLDLIEYHNNTCNELNITTADRDNLSEILNNRLIEVEHLRKDLNNTKNSLTGAIENATIYRRFYEEMTSYSEGFGFRIGGENNQYKTIYQYEREIADYESATSGFPILLFFAVATAIVISLMIGYWKWAKKRSSPEELEMLEGVDPTTTLVNRFKSRLPIKPRNVKIKETSKAVVEQKIEKKEPKTANNYDEIRKELDEKINNVEKRMETSLESRHNQIMQELRQISGGSGGKTPI